MIARQDLAIRLQKRAFSPMCRSAIERLHAVLGLTVAVAFAFALTTATANATTYSVDTLQDTSGNADCSLRDAINAANGNPTSGATCATAGTGSDAINISVTGTISLVSTLPTITDSSLTITGPTSTAAGIKIDGGGSVQLMKVTLGTLGLQFVTLAHGKLTGCNAAGSAIFDFGGTVNIVNSTVSGNTTVSGCDTKSIYGAIFISVDATLTVTNSTLLNNSTMSVNIDAPGLGAAIANFGTATITNSTFSGNQGDAGGAIFDAESLTVINSTFSANDASAAGGAIAETGSGTITNSTFSGNQAGSGSGKGGGAIWVDNIELASFATASLKGDILASSTNGNCVSAGGSGSTIIDAGYNISDDNTCGFTKTGSANNGDNVNPELSSAGLAPNGGPTETIAPVLGSPAIDAIPVANCTDQASTPNSITTDQRGFRRPDAGEDVCDIGAYESQDSFAGQIGGKNCYSVSVSTLSNQYGGLGAAAMALGFRSTQAIKSAIQAYCRG